MTKIEAEKQIAKILKQLEQDTGERVDCLGIVDGEIFDITDMDCTSKEYLQALPARVSIRMFKPPVRVWP